MQLKDNQIRFMNVEVLWPRLDMPYKQNSATGQWDKCTSILDEDGKYEVIVKFQPAQAEEPETGGDSDVPVTKWQDLFKETDDGRFQRKLQIRTYKDPNTKPKIYDHHFEEIGIKDREPDFEMTTGSMVHCVVDLKSWTFGGKHGISTRPEAFAVLTRAERKPPPDQQEKVNHFGDLAQPKEKSEGAQIFGDMEVPDTPEPMARQTVEAASPFPQAEKKEDIAVHPSLEDGPQDEIPF